MSTTPHDALFKTIFSQPEHAAGELRLALPPSLVAHLDFATLTLRPGSFVDEALRERSTDLLFSVQLAGHEAFIYLLFEHQSRPERLMAFRLLRYMVRIWESLLKDQPQARSLPLIIPVVLAQGETGWRVDTAFEMLYDATPEILAAAGEHAIRLRFVLDDLRGVSDGELHARTMSALGRLGLWCLRNARTPEELVRGIGDWLDLVREVRRAPNGRAALAVLWRYIFATNEKKQGAKILQRLLRAVGRDETKEEIMSAADDFIEKGRRKGRREGIAEGKRQMLLRLLRTRFGELAETLVARIEAAGTAELDLWAERVLSARTPEEVVAKT